MYQKEWSSFRITLLLYILLLILPFSFYFVSTSFKTMQTDTKIVRQISLVERELKYFSANHNNQYLQHIDEILEEISLWVIQNNESDLYIGGQTLSKDFLEIQNCWIRYKSKSEKNYVKQCSDLINNLAITIEKMVYLKQKEQINLFYVSLSIAMLLILLIIFFVRTYIHTQMKKNAIHDHETRLFNKKYFMAELKMSCSRSTRHLFPLSMLRVSINNLEKGNKTYSEGEKRNTLKVFGKLVHSLVRDGDIPCRYDDNRFLILLPFTEEHNALTLKKRIEEALQKDNWMGSKQISFDFNITEFDKKESEKAFIVRTLA